MDSFKWDDLAFLADEAHRLARPDPMVQMLNNSMFICHTDFAYNEVS